LFSSLSELLPMAEQRRETLIPVLIDGRLEFHVAENFVRQVRLSLNETIIRLLIFEITRFYY
jgi:hypothetical protein